MNKLLKLKINNFVKNENNAFFKKQKKIMVNEKLKDFRNFLYLSWKHLNLPEPTETIIYKVGDYNSESESEFDSDGSY